MLLETSAHCSLHGSNETVVVHTKSSPFRDWHHPSASAAPPAITKAAGLVSKSWITATATFTLTAASSVVPDRVCASTGLVFIDIFNASSGILLTAIVMLLCYLCANALFLLPLLLLAYASKPDYVMLHCCSLLLVVVLQEKRGNLDSQVRVVGLRGWEGILSTKPDCIQSRIGELKSKALIELNKAVGAATVSYSSEKIACSAVAPLGSES